MWHGWGRRQIHTTCWCENLKEKDHLEDVDTDGIMILILILKKMDGRMCDWINLAEERNK